MSQLIKLDFYVYLPPRNHFNFNLKGLQDVIVQLPSPFMGITMMGDFNGLHTLWGCEEVNNRGQKSKDSNMNQPRISWMPIALLWWRLAEISDTIRTHLGEFMSPRWILKHRLNLYGIGSTKSSERNPVKLFIMYLDIWISGYLVTFLLTGGKQLSFLFQSLVILPIIVLLHWHVACVNPAHCS